MHSNTPEFTLIQVSVETKNEIRTDRNKSPFIFILCRFPRNGLKLLLFFIIWSFGSSLFAQPGARRRVECYICHYLTWADSIKASCFQTLDAVFPKDIVSFFFSSIFHREQNTQHFKV